MAVKLRLVRFGKKKKPFYRLAAAESTNARDGEVVEFIGKYDPQQEPVFFEIDEEKVKAWIAKGAQPTQTVNRLLAEKGIGEKVEYTSANQKISKKERKAKTEENK